MSPVSRPSRHRLAVPGVFCAGPEPVWVWVPSNSLPFGFESVVLVTSREKSLNTLKALRSWVLKRKKAEEDYSVHWVDLRNILNDNRVAEYTTGDTYFCGEHYPEGMPIFNVAEIDKAR